MSSTGRVRSSVENRGTYRRENPSVLTDLRSRVQVDRNGRLQQEQRREWMSRQYHLQAWFQIRGYRVQNWCRQPNYLARSCDIRHGFDC